MSKLLAGSVCDVWVCLYLTVSNCSCVLIRLLDSCVVSLSCSAFCCCSSVRVLSSSLSEDCKTTRRSRTSSRSTAERSQQSQTDSFVHLVHFRSLKEVRFCTNSQNPSYWLLNQLKTHSLNCKLHTYASLFHQGGSQGKNKFWEPMWASEQLRTHHPSLSSYLPAAVPVSGFSPADGPVFPAGSAAPHWTSTVREHHQTPHAHRNQNTRKPEQYYKHTSSVRLDFSVPMVTCSSSLLICWSSFLFFASSSSNWPWTRRACS